MERSILIYSSTTGTKKTVVTDATTWGQLKSLPEVASMIPDNMIGAVKETKVELNNPEARLPEGPCTIFVVQSKTKAGITAEELKQRVIDTLNLYVDEIADDVVSTIQEELPEGTIEENDEDLARQAAEFVRR